MDPFWLKSLRGTIQTGLAVNFYCSFDYEVKWRTSQRKVESGENLDKTE